MSDVYDVKFKGERKTTYRAMDGRFFQVGDYVVVDAEKGEDLGVVSQKRIKDLNKEDRDSMQKIRRSATPEDMDKWKENRAREKESFGVCSDKIKDHNLNMKLVDVEYQFDRNKITFFFTAEKRIDFRALVKDLASIYNTRIELRQIGVRDEARRIGGYGHCGLELCCATFKDEFEPVTTKMAREQLLQVNPRKLSGACGRLMCCLEYEHKFYKKELSRYPAVGSKIRTEKGNAIVGNVDIFRETIHLRYRGQDDENIPLKDLNILEHVEGPDESRQGRNRRGKDKRKQQGGGGGRNRDDGRNDRKGKGGDRNRGGQPKQEGGSPERKGPEKSAEEAPPKDMSQDQPVKDVAPKDTPQEQPVKDVTPAGPDEQERSDSDIGDTPERSGESNE